MQKLILRNTELVNILSSLIPSISYFAAAQNMAGHTVSCQVMGMFITKSTAHSSIIQGIWLEGGAQIIDKHR